MNDFCYKYELATHPLVDDEMNSGEGFLLRIKTPVSAPINAAMITRAHELPTTTKNLFRLNPRISVSPLGCLVVSSCTALLLFSSGGNCFSEANLYAVSALRG